MPLLVDHSSSGEDFDISKRYDSKKVKQVVASLANFEPKTELDRKLLLGIL